MNTLLYKYKSFLLIALFITSLSSCEKEIDIDLKSVPPRIAIEGIVKQGQLATVHVTQTQDFDNNDKYANLSGAIVTISDDQGNSEVLKQGANGWYTAENENLKGVVGRKYNLSVKYDGQEYTATSQMPPHVPLKDISFDKIALIDYPFPVVHFADPKGELNQYYRALVFINGKQHPRMNEFPISAEFVDGDSDIGWPLDLNTDDEDNDPLKKGDELTIEFQCIDKGTYKFFDSLANPVGTPTNPISNISNGALGYFSACTTQKMTVIADWED